MREKVEAPCYGFRGGVFISSSLIGLGVATTALAIAFTVLPYSLWQVAVSWFFGVVLLIAGAIWDSMSSVAYPANVRALEESLLTLLRASRWDGRGNVLDIGTGGGRLAVPVAREFPEAHVTGVDVWSKWWGTWGLSRERAERNAMIDGVGDRCTFQYGSALELPFQDGEFSLVVSAFTFHEVNVPDRTVLLKEAFRVMAPDGNFVICDLFPRGYGVRNVPELLEKVQHLGVDDVRHESLKEAGVDLGGLSFIWGMSYLSGKKRRRQS